MPTYIRGHGVGLFAGTPWADIRNFGAVADGSTNCTAAFTAAQTAAGARGRVYIPPGTWLMDQLSPAGVHIVGEGPQTSILKARSMATDFFTNGAGTGTNEAGSLVEGVCFDGTNMTGSGAVVKLTNGLLTDVSPSYTLRDVWAINGPGHGFNTAASGGSLSGDCYEACFARNNASAGWNMGPDQAYLGCVAGHNGLQGFFSNGHSAWYMASCKSYDNGHVTPSSGHGFHFAGESSGASLASCHSQDNQAAGFLFDSSNALNGGVAATGIVSDSNSRRGAGSNAAVQFFNYKGAYIEYVSTSRTAGTCFQQNALTFSGSTGNTVICQAHYATSGSTAVSAYLSSQTSVAGNMVRLGNGGGVQVPAFAASYTPDLSLGSIVKPAVLTAAITVNAPTNPATGNVYEFFFTEDGTGGWNVTWNAAFVFQVAWTNVGNTAGKRSSVRFLYDGTNYISLSPGVNVWF